MMITAPKLSELFLTSSLYMQRLLSLSGTVVEAAPY